MKTVEVALALTCGLSLALVACAGAPRSTAPDDKLAKRFRDQRPGVEVLTAESGDVNADGREDVIAVYREGGLVRTRVLLETTAGPVLTNEVKAPLEDQAVDLKDIDGKPPAEFVVRGAKGPNVGYAIYRVTGDRLVDVFGSGMGGCCGR